MAITNTTTPTVYNFSRNFIPVAFTSDNFAEQAGITSVNILTLISSISNGEQLKFKFGSYEVVFTATNTTVDDSGLQFPAGSFSSAYTESLIPYFRANHIIDSNYIISFVSGTIHFTARNKGVGFDFTAFNYDYGTITNSIAGQNQVIKSGFSIEFELYCQTSDHLAYEKIHAVSLSVDFKAGGLARVDLAERLNSFMEKDILDIPDPASTDPLECKKSCRKFYYTFAERWDSAVKKKHTSAIYTVLSGGLSTKGSFVNTLSALLVPDAGDATKDRFLKQGSSHQVTRADQPQFLYFFNTRVAAAGAKLRCKFHFTDGTSPAAITVETFDLATLTKYAFTITHDLLFTPADYPDKVVEYYEIWLEAAGGTSLSEIRTYWMDYKVKPYVRYFLSWSSWGAMDSRDCYGQATSSLELVQQEARRIRQAGDDIKKGNASVFDLSINNEFKVSTGHISRNELIHNRDFFLSAHKFRYAGGLMLPIKVTSKNIPELEDGKTRFYQEFEYKYLFDDDVFTEGDVNEPGVGFDGFFFNSVNPLLPANGLVETDPTVPSWVKSITQGDINKWNQFNIAGYHNVNWDEAYNRGPHTGLYAPMSGSSNYIQNRYDYQTSAKFNVYGGKFKNYLVLPTEAPIGGDLEEGEYALYVDEDGIGGVMPPVIANYDDLGDVNITGRADGYIPYWDAASSSYKFKLEGSGNAYTISQIQNFFGGLTGITGYNKTNWDDGYTKATSAYGWGNHAELYPLYNGTGATGTWGINISGNAASAAQWGYRSANLLVETNTPIAFLGLESEGTAKYIGQDKARSFLGLSDVAVTGDYADLSGLPSLGSNAYTSTAYLPSSGGILTGNLNITNNANTGVGFTVNNNNSGAIASSYYQVTDGTRVSYFGMDGNGTSTTRKNRAYLYNNGNGIVLQAVDGSGDIKMYTGGENLRYTLDATGNNAWAGSGTFGGAITAPMGTFTDGSQGLIIRPYTGFGGYGAIYSTNVTPGHTNYGLAINGDGAYLNAGLITALVINGTAIFTVMSTGASLTQALEGTSATFSGQISAPKTKVTTLLTIPTAAPGAGDMADGEVAIWAEGF